MPEAKYEVLLAGLILRVDKRSCTMMVPVVSLLVTLIRENVAFVPEQAQSYFARCPLEPTCRDELGPLRMW